jgi:hypothetical protein
MAKALQTAADTIQNQLYMLHMEVVTGHIYLQQLSSGLTALL